jgi:hypothetical protein
VSRRAAVVDRERHFFARLPEGGRSRRVDEAGFDAG